MNQQEYFSALDLATEVVSACAVLVKHQVIDNSQQAEFLSKYLADHPAFKTSLNERVAQIMNKAEAA
ncbi:MAG TPA: hypothetical protein VK974_04845 [Methylophilaceae bacterium]|nr:hypothetical protein [Methylophilaceae bacterium]